jgi:hypothetical protein
MIVDLNGTFHYWLATTGDEKFLVPYGETNQQLLSGQRDLKIEWYPVFYRVIHFEQIDTDSYTKSEGGLRLDFFQFSIYFLLVLDIPFIYKWRMSKKEINAQLLKE